MIHLELDQSLIGQGLYCFIFILLSQLSDIKPFFNCQVYPSLFFFPYYEYPFIFVIYVLSVVYILKKMIIRKQALHSWYSARVLVVKNILAILGAKHSELCSLLYRIMDYDITCTSKMLGWFSTLSIIGFLFHSQLKILRSVVSNCLLRYFIHVEFLGFKIIC